jgi:GTP cyclohydrolase I
MVSKSLRHLSSTTDITSLSESDKCYLTKMQAAVTVLLKGIGEDPLREGLRDTPRVR